MGLPYEQDPVLTKQIAAFLRRHVEIGFPSKVLFNGGFFHADVLRESVLGSLVTWGVEQGVELTSLPDPDLNGAVAFGASVFGLSRHGRAKRIGGGTSVNYYVTERRSRKGKKRGRVGICLLPKAPRVHIS